MQDIQHYTDTVRNAAASGKPLALQGNGTRAFLGRTTRGDPLSMADYHGIIDYSPSELVISARAGTPLAHIEQALAAEQQMLAFEPPAFGPTATLGGTIAGGLSGPRRPWSGAARDFVLGINCINGHGEYLRFGGQVMKNVAGYDLSRTLTGSLGTLAILLDIHLKVLPRPEAELTLTQTCTQAEAIERCNHWSANPISLTAACYIEDRLVFRLSGTERGVADTASRLGGDTQPGEASIWQDLKEQTLPFFAGDAPVWRLSLPPASTPLDSIGEQLLDWGGAQRWLRSTLPATDIRETVQAAGGHAQLFRGGDRSGEVFHPLAANVLSLHQRLKAAFDPHAIFNPGRMYAEL
ncbi:MAG TPA: glycolate oxidase subunit GlcE [Gammaproteobacteria bacterium]|jgi:glycolate oxidase FAD binding subunit|nr:glycolate oxidase subunit GlcE [Gammaproteobacteria bacterium]